MKGVPQQEPSIRVNGWLRGGIGGSCDEVVVPSLGAILAVADASSQSCARAGVPKSFGCLSFREIGS